MVAEHQSRRVHDDFTHGPVEMVDFDSAKNTEQLENSSPSAAKSATVWTEQGLIVAEAVRKHLTEIKV